MEEAEESVMDEKPRPKHEGFFANGYAVKIVLEGIVIGAVTLIAYLIGQNAAVSLDDNCDIAAKQLADLVSNPDKLKEMKQKCQKIAKPYSALNTYKLAQQLAKDKEDVK